jgi:amidase
MRLGQLSLPLAPMLGCFGVAPAEGQALSTATSGPHGNMDYRGFVSGVTVYFPVAVAGLCCLRAMGTHCKVMAKSLEQGSKSHLISRSPSSSKRASRSPGGERRIGITSLPWATGGHLINASNMRPVRCCAGCKLTINWIPWANLLLGQCGYDLGNMFDPAYTMICKVPRQLLPRQ